MALSAGTRLGPYEILSALGARGMGEVYRAKELRLNREFASKLLPAAFSNNSERLRRFVQEAQAARALNRPNMLAVYDVGTHDGMFYVVSELLRGETLRKRLIELPIPARQAIDYAIQIAQSDDRPCQSDRAPRPKAGELVRDQGWTDQDSGLRISEDNADGPIEGRDTDVSEAEPQRPGEPRSARCIRSTLKKCMGPDREVQMRVAKPQKIIGPQKAWL